jgi:hypothetical protein
VLPGSLTKLKLSNRKNELTKVLALLLEIEAAQKIACMDDQRFDDVADRVLR